MAAAYVARVKLDRPDIIPTPVVLRTHGWRDYGLVDSGDGRKLERYGQVRVVRPEPQCLWRPALDEAAWAKADAVFDPADEDDAGRWRFPGKTPPESWPLSWGQAKFLARCTSFRHLAFFPEQAANWEWLETAVTTRANEGGAAPKVLNLFGYTGVASLVCAAAGAAVTHVDASKKSVAQARENAALSGLDDRPIRWICEDARRYVQREVRRGSKYEGVILDPPKYGRGPEARSGVCSRTCPNSPPTAPPFSLTTRNSCSSTPMRRAFPACRWPTSWPMCCKGGVG